MSKVTIDCRVAAVLRLEIWDWELRGEMCAIVSLHASPGSVSLLSLWEDRKDGGYSAAYVMRWVGAFIPRQSMMEISS